MTRHVEPQQRVHLVSILSIDRVDGIEIVLDLQAENRYHPEEDCRGGDVG